MNTKKFKYIFIINLFVIMLSTMQLSYVFATPIIDEIEQSIPQEETNTIDNINTIQDIPTPEINNKSDAINNLVETDNSGDKKLTFSAPADFYNKLPRIDELNSTEPNYERKKILNKKIKNNCILLSKFINKINEFIQRTQLNENYVVRIIATQLNKLNLFINYRHTITTIDYSPYYFIMPDIQNNYLVKIISPDKISNIMELLPFSLTIQKNTICKMSTRKNVITPLGTTDIFVLMNAPSPKIEVLNKKCFAKLVIDIRNNTLYKYDKNGFPLKAYLVATGASGMRTRSGLRIVTYKERFPYSGDPTSLRAQDPFSYGPYIIFVNVIDPKTGRQTVIQQLLHGNGNEYSIGKKVSHGCVRTNNSVMKYELSKEIKRGDYILLINPDID